MKMTDRAGERKRERVALPQKTIGHSREGQEMRGTDEEGEREGWKRERERGIEEGEREREGQMKREREREG